MGWPFAYMIGVPASASSGSLSRSSHTRAIPGASAGICACDLGTSPGGGAQATGASRQTPSKASLMRWYFMIRMILPVRSLSKELGELRRRAADRCGLNHFAVVGPQHANIDLAQP